MDHDEWASTPFPQYTDAQVAEIVKRSPVEEVIAEHTAIAKKPDGTYAGACPFCTNPSSLQVAPADGRWRCDNCLETGSVIVFVSKVRELWWADAVKFLADIVHNPALGIVYALRPVAEHAATIGAGGFDEILVFYLEVYGSKQLPAWKHYGAGQPAWRLFDVASIPADMLEWQVERIASWRQAGGQDFASEWVLGDLAKQIGVDVTPRLFEIDGADLPASVEGMRAFLEEYRFTQVDTTGEAGLNEGIVLRVPDRSVISKARFQDYDRTLKRRRQASTQRPKGAAQQSGEA